MIFSMISINLQVKLALPVERNTNHPRELERRPEFFKHLWSFNGHGIQRRKFLNVDTVITRPVNGNSVTAFAYFTVVSRFCGLILFNDLIPVIFLYIS